MASLDPQPPINFKLVDSEGIPSNAWQGYFLSLDRLVRGLAGGVIGPLPSAANDTAAAHAGVKIGGLYQSAGTVRIRLT
jgi:hypothetical protein